MRSKSKLTRSHRRYRRLRERIMAENPYCAVCGRVADVLDHIKPLCDGGALMDRANLQPICRPCHEQKTLAEQAARTGVAPEWKELLTELARP